MWAFWVRNAPNSEFLNSLKQTGANSCVRGLIPIFIISYIWFFLDFSSAVCLLSIKIVGYYFRLPISHWPASLLKFWSCYSENPLIKSSIKIIVILLPWAAYHLLGWGPPLCNVTWAPCYRCQQIGHHIILINQILRKWRWHLRLHIIFIAPRIFDSPRLSCTSHFHLTINIIPRNPLLTLHQMKLVGKCIHSSKPFSCDYWIWPFHEACHEFNCLIHV